VVAVGYPRVAGLDLIKPGTGILVNCQELAREMDLVCWLF